MMSDNRQVAVIGDCMPELQGQAFGTLQQRQGGDALNTAVCLSRLGPAVTDATAP